jgi:predicted N-acetyltransferase YhbS
MIREIRESDIPIITDICRKGMRFDYFNESIVREKTIEAVDYDPELGMVYENDDGTIAGFAQCVIGERRRRCHGWIRLMVVHPVHRRHGVGSAILAECEKRLASRGARAISTMNAVPNYFTLGIDYRYTDSFCFLLKHGYKRVDEGLNLVCDVEPGMFELDDEIKEFQDQGFEVKRAGEEDLDALLEFIQQQFPPWEGEVRSGYRNNPVSVYICKKDTRVLGFAAYDTNNKNTGWFGPMGVLREARGKGIGGIVLKLCLRDIALQGHSRAIISGVGPVYFYSRLCNARMDRVFWVWEKSFKQ